MNDERLKLTGGLIRGGTRPNAGRKTKAPTTTIRVPSDIANSIKAIAANHHQAWFDFCNNNQTWKWGDATEIPLVIEGVLRMVPAVVVPGWTQVPACEWPKRGGVKEIVVQCPYTPPGTVAFSYRWGEVTGFVTVSLDKLRRLNHA